MKDYLHPLSDFKIIENEEGKLIEIMNSWGVASLCWSTLKFGSKTQKGNAFKFCRELGLSIPQINELLKQNNEAADMQAINHLANALEEKIEKAFEEKKL